ncbi:MAG: ClbS/DfsB family four-helix bundle protein [Bacteroidota bacterium]
MPRPKSKEGLLIAKRENYQKLMVLVDSYSPKEQEKDFPPGTLNRNIRDVFGHLYHWQILFVGWYTTGMKGENPNIPAKGYNWRETPDLNILIQQTYAGIPLSEMRPTLHTSHLNISAIINAHSQEELFTRKYFNWTGSNSLAAYITGATSSHYAWAHKLIKKCKKPN